jgi:hypothetical protein
MLRKAILGLSAALIITTAVAPSAALAHGKGNGNHHHHNNHHKKWNKWDKWSSGYGYGYGGGCWTKAKVWSDYYGEYVWKKVNICY